MRNEYMGHRMKVLRLINGIVLLQILYRTIIINKLRTNGAELFEYFESMMVAVLFIVLVASLFKKFQESYDKGLICVVWFITASTILYEIGMVFDYKSLLLCGTMLIFGYALLETKKAFYVASSVVVLSGLLGVLLYGQVNRQCIDVFILFFFIGFVFYLMIEYKEKMMGVYDYRIGFTKRILRHTSDAYAYHQLVYDDTGIAVDYKYLEINERFTELTGLSRDDVVGHTVLELMPKTESYWIEAYANIVATKKPTTFINYSGSLESYYRVHAYPEGTDRFVTLFADVSDKLKDDRTLNTALRNAQKANGFKTQFLRDVNHKLRTPLNGMMGLMQLVNIDGLGEEEKELMDGIHLEMQRSRNILNQIAEYVKIQDIDYVVTESDLDIQLQEIIHNLNNPQGPTIQLVHGDGPMQGLFYEGRVLEKVVNALLNNAISYAHCDKIEVLVGDMVKGKNVTTIPIHVVDNGVGIPEEQKVYLFNELHHHDFVHLERDTEHISLPICKMLCEQIGGSLTLDDTDDGSCFTFNLPVFDKIG